MRSWVRQHIPRQSRPPFLARGELVLGEFALAQSLSLRYLYDYDPRLSSLGRYFVLATPLAAFATGAVVGATMSSGFAWQESPQSNAAPSAPARQTLAQTYPAEVLHVIDGDTFEARVRVWPGIEVHTKVRLRGIDAPELSARCDDAQTRAQSARDALATLLSRGEVRIGAVSLDKFGGRIVASASARDTPDIVRH